MRVKYALSCFIVNQMGLMKVIKSSCKRAKNLIKGVSDSYE